jgi:ubiquitin carboxyl-terminal hydrolase 7
MIFLKHFDTSKQTLTGAGKVYMARTAKVADLAPVINEKMRWTPGTPLKLYEEIKPGMIELMKPKFSFSQSEIQDGDVICFQVDIPEKESAIIIITHTHCLILIIRAHDLESQGLHSNPIHFYDFLQNRVMIIFRPKYEEVDPQEYPEFHLVLSKKQNYDTVRIEALLISSSYLTFSTKVVGKGWRVSETRSNKAPLHDNTSY